MRFCHACGQTLRGEERFCGACGRPTAGDTATVGATGAAGADTETVAVPARSYGDPAEPGRPRGRRVALVSGAVAALLVAGGVSAYALTRASGPGDDPAAAPASSATTDSTTTGTPTATTGTPARPTTRAATSASATPQSPVTVTVPGPRRTVTASPAPAAPAPEGTDNDDENTGTAADDGTNLPFYDLGSSHLVFASLPKGRFTLAQARRYEAGLGGGVTAIDSDVAPWLRSGYWVVVSARSYPTGAEALRHCADHGRASGGDCYARKVHR